LRIKKQLPGYQPLCYVKDGLLLSHNKKIFISDCELENVRFLCDIPSTLKDKFILRSRVLSRIFRLHVRFAINVSNEFVLIVCGSNLWRINLETMVVRLDFVIPDNRTALYLTLVEGNGDRKDKVVFGEYFSNPNMDKVRVWGTDVDDVSSWHQLYEFKPNEINHVHNIICNEQQDDCYILAGDFEGAASIWKTDKEFETIAPWVRGKQKYRACWGIASGDGLAYATDTPLEFNSFCHMEGKEITSSEQIEGSSIYFGQNRNKYFFSTTVEPGEPSGSFIKDTFSYKLGEGILSNISKLYSVSSQNSIKVEFEGVKDILPARLGQFGCFMFPSGTMDSNDIIVYGVALESIDGCCLLLGDSH